MRTWVLCSLVLFFPLAACGRSREIAAGTPPADLAATVSALETHIAGLQSTLDQAASIPTVSTPTPETTGAIEPATLVVPTPFTGRIVFAALAYSPEGGAIDLATTLGLVRNKEGDERLLYSWPEAILDPLATFSVDGRVLASRLNNGDITLLRLPGGELLRTISADEWPSSLALSADGTRLAAALGEDNVLVWDVASGDVQDRLAPATGGGVVYQELAFAPDGNTLLGGFLNTITRWDLVTGQASTFDPGCRGDFIFDLAFSKAGDRLAVVCGPSDAPVGFLIVWNVAGNRPVFQREEIAQMRRVTFSPDGSLLASGGLDGSVTLWEAKGDREPVTFQSHDSTVTGLAFSPHGSELVSVAQGGLAFLNLAEVKLP